MRSTRSPTSPCSCPFSTHRRCGSSTTAGSFRFANATAVVGPNVPVSGTGLSARARIAVVIGAGGEIGGTTAMVEWHDPAEQPDVKRSDFGIVLGPVVVTPDETATASFACRLSAGERTVEGAPAAFSWAEALALAAHRTMLRPGDVIAGPPVVVLDERRRRRGARGRRDRHAAHVRWEPVDAARPRLGRHDHRARHAPHGDRGVRRRRAVPRARGADRARADAQRGDRRRDGDDLGTVRRGARLAARHRRRQAGPAGARRRARSAHHLGRLPRADRAGARPRGRRGHGRREPHRGRPDGLALDVPRAGGMRGVRRAVQAGRPRRHGAVRLRRRRHLRPVRVARGGARVRPLRSRRSTSPRRACPSSPSRTCTTSARRSRRRAASYVRSEHRPPRAAAAIRLPRLHGAVPLLRRRPRQRLARRRAAPRHRRAARCGSRLRPVASRSSRPTTTSCARLRWLLGAPLDLEPLLGLGAGRAGAGRPGGAPAGVPAATRPGSLGDARRSRSPRSRCRSTPRSRCGRD